MKKQNISGWKIMVSALLMVLLSMSLASAEKKIFHGTGEYTMSDYETPAVAEQRALAYAKNNAAEQAGAYVDTYTKMEKVQVTEDRVNVLVSGAMRVTAENVEKIAQSDGDIRIVANITAEMDTEEINQMLSKAANSIMDDGIEYRQLNEKIAKEESETTKLKKKIEEMKLKKLPVQDLQIEIKAKEQMFLSNQKVKEAREYGIRGEFDKALSLSEDAVRLNPKSADAYAVRAESNGSLKNYDLCIKDCERSLQIKPDNARAYNSRGLSYVYKGEYDKALIEINKALQIDPYYAGAFYSRGMAYNGKREYENAMNDYDRAIQYNIKNIDVYISRGNIYYIKRDFHNAINDCTKALEKNPRYWLAYYNRAVCYLQIDEYNKAIYDLEMVLKLNPNGSDAREILNELYQMRQGR